MRALPAQAAIACLLVLSCFLSLPRAIAAETNLTADAIILRAVERSQKAAATPPGAFAFNKLTLREEFSASGKLKQRKRKEYRITFRDGVTRTELVSVNGHAPAPEDLKEQTQNEQSAGKLLGQGSARTDNRDTFLTPEMIAHYTFTLLGETNLNGRQTFELRLQPQIPEPPERHLIDRLLNHLTGTIWIDSREYELAAAHLHLAASVDLFGGIIASLKKLDYTLSRTRVADGLWLNTSSMGDFQGRKFLESLRVKTESQLTDIHPLALTGKPRPKAGG